MSNTVPKEWQIKTVDEVATVFAGGTPSRSNPDYYEGTIPWVKSGEVNSRLIYRTEETISELAVKESSARWAKRGSVLVAMYGATAGKAARLMIDATLNQAVSAINGRENTADNWFLLYAIENNTRELLNTVQGSGQPNLSGQLIKTLNLPIPPLPEQQKIAAILSSVDDVIEKTRAQIDKLKDLKTGMMQELLTKGIGHTEFKDSPVGRIPASWDVQLLHDVCERVCVGFVGTCERHYRASGVPMIRTGNLKDGKLDLTGVRHVTDEFHKKEKKSQLKAGDLLIARHGSHGSACLVPENLGEANCLNVVIVRPSQTLAMPLFLKYVFNSGAMKASFGAKSEGSTQSVISTTEIAKTAFPIPSIAEQRQISAALSTIDGRIESVERKLTNSIALKKALMQDLLTGKVRVKIDQKESAVA
tara:strand:+ start:4143 stop:5399 length:1257 start_codon:yes stop_codon:yes gene_type:complete